MNSTLWKMALTGLLIFVPAAHLLGVPAAGTPTPSEITALGYNSPEPLLATLQLVGSSPFSRPEVGGGIFAPAHRTVLSMVAFDQDVIVRPEENELLYEYLTGETGSSRLAAVVGAGAVHDLYIADPAGLLAAVAGTIRF